MASAAAAARDEDAGMLVVSAPDNVSTSTLTDADAITQSSEDIHRRSFQSVVDDTAAGVPALDVNGRDIRQDALQRTGDDGALSYTFDALDRLVLVNRASQEELRLAYDGVGRRRLERRQMLGGHVEDAVLEYDGPNVIEESDVETGGLYVATTHAPGVDAPLLVTLAEGRATPTFILRTNARGDAVAAGEDETGQIVEEADLSAWGEREIAARAGEPCVEGAEGRDGPRRISLPVGVCALHSRVLGRFGIGGARAHPGTKLVDLRNRVYAPHLRAFLTRDPLGTVDAQGLYAYAGDPINLRDPWGLTKGQEAANQGPEIGPDDPVWEYVDTPSGEKETTVGARRKNQGPAGGCANNPQECLESRERERQEQLERTQGRGEAQRRAVEDRGAPDGGGGDDEADFLRRHPFIGGFMYGFAQVPLPRPAPPPPRPQRIAKLGYGGPSGIVDEVVRALGGRICNSSYCPTVGETAVLVAMTVASTRSDARPPNLSPLGVGRRGAFNAAKRDSGIPTSQQPSVVRPNVDRRGNEQPGRVYEFEVPSPGGGPPRTVTIRDDVGGHVFPDDPGQDRGPHFNTEGGGHYEY